MQSLKAKHLQEIMDYLPEVIIEAVETEESYMIHWMNRKARQRFGESLLEQPLTAIMSFSQMQSMLFDFKRFRSVEKVLIRLDERMYELSGTLNHRYIELILKDITEHERIKHELKQELERQNEKRMQNEYLLMQQSKLATMGEMIGNIAHQWRQPLAELGGIFMNLDAANRFGELDSDVLNARIQSGNELLKHMSRTIDDFRHFFEPNCDQKEFDVVEYLESAISIVQASLTLHNITLRRNFLAIPILITGYPGEFSQVVLNLLANAKEALIERKVADPEIAIEIVQEDTKIIIRIEDNAGGISEEIIDVIFNIYFTTKSEGTGLGLYMSRLIVETKLHGTLSVKNGNKGACFRLCILRNNDT